MGARTPLCLKLACLRDDGARTPGRDGTCLTRLSTSHTLLSKHGGAAVLDAALPDDVLQEFLVESYENLDLVDAHLLTLERGEATSDTLASIFRSVHTIKGTCGFLGLAKLETVAHHGESLLSLLRDGKVAAGPEVTDTLLRTVDVIRSILNSIEREGHEGDESHERLLADLSLLTTRACAPKADASGAGVEAPPPVEAPANTPQPRKPSPVTPAETGALDVQSRPSAVDNTIRVDIVLLDRVMNLVGELVLARNRILQFASHTTEPGFANASQRLNLLTTELQEAVMKTRMQPIGNVWNKFPRMVRDVAIACGKRVELELDGVDTELDRTIIEAIKDPLTHAIRNAIDHGVETPDLREACGKPAVARLCLRAYHEGGQVNIEISDDGAGLDFARIRQRAVEQGLVSTERSVELDERELGHLIFHPGFSTANAITNVSGRGVGMDVIKTNIEKIGGSIDISSVRGRGTCLKMKIPLTLAIIPALIVTSRGERFAIPQVNLHELVRIEKDDARGIERLYGAAFYRLRGKLLPLVFLGETLALPEDQGEPDAINIVVLQADGRQYGVVVDAIRDTEEIVVKPLGKELRGLSVFAGATIMGDGQVALILDVLGLALRANLRSSGVAQATAEEKDSPTVVAAAQESLLLFRSGPGNRMAIPLAWVARLEEIQRSSVELSAGRPVVQYRGSILPLIDLAGALGPGTQDRSDSLTVIVHMSGRRSVGIVVDEILDAVAEAISVRDPNRRPGTLGTVVIGGKVTDLLDVDSLIRRADPYLLSEEDAA